MMKKRERFIGWKSRRWERDKEKRRKILIQNMQPARGRAFKIKMRKIWCILRNKDYYYSDVILTKEDFAELKRYLEQY